MLKKVTFIVFVLLLCTGLALAAEPKKGGTLIFGRRATA